jgi:fumarate reductase subunit D
MREPIIFAVYFDGGWSAVILHVASVLITLLLAFGLYREYRIRKTWEPIMRALQQLGEQHPDEARHREGDRP